MVGVSNTLNFSVTVLESGGGNFTITTPEIYAVEIATTTTDNTPTINLRAGNTPAWVALSCDGGVSWSDWISYPTDDELNTNNDADFDITAEGGCSADVGEKTLTVKLKNNYGYESTWLSATTIYTSGNTYVASPDYNYNSPTSATTPTQAKEIIIPLIEEAKNVNPRLIEVGYRENALWKSFTDTTINAATNTIEITSDENENVGWEVRVVDAEILDDYAENVATIGSNKPVLINANGKTQTNVLLTSEAGVAVKIPATTIITDAATNSTYNRVFYSPQRIDNPPAATNSNLSPREAYFIGSSSTHLNFDKPITLTFPLTSDLANPKFSILMKQPRVGFWWMMQKAENWEE